MSQLDDLASAELNGSPLLDRRMDNILQMAQVVRFTYERLDTGFEQVSKVMT